MNTPDQERLVEQLRSVAYFEALDDATLRQLAALATWHSYATGALVFLEGEEAAGLYGMHSGWIKVVKSSLDGREQVLRYFGPGEVFNEIGVFLALPNPATAVALEACVLWQLRRAALAPVLSAHPDILMQLLANLAGRVVYLAGMVADLSLHSVEVRLARLLLDEASGGRLDRQPWLTQTELAARLGTVPDVLSRALRSLADAGLIAVERRHITVLDAKGLARRGQVVE